MNGPAWRGVVEYKAKRAAEDLTTLASTARVVENREEANIALATRLGGRKNFAVMGGIPGTGKEIALLEHFSPDAKVLVLCKPHMVNIWRDGYAGHAKRSVRAYSYFKAVHLQAERVNDAMLEDHDELVIADAHGARACHELGLLVKRSKQRTVYVGSLVGDPGKAVHWARLCLNREREDFSWVVIPRGPIHL